MLLIMALSTNLWLSSCGVHREQYFRSKRPNRAVYALLGLCHYPEKGQVENFTQLGNMTQIEAPYVMQAWLVSFNTKFPWAKNLPVTLTLTKIDNHKVSMIFGRNSQTPNKLSKRVFTWKKNNVISY